MSDNNEKEDKDDSAGSPRGSIGNDSDEEIKIAEAMKTTDVKFGKTDKDIEIK